jgi:hypothetical protein
MTGLKVVTKVNKRIAVRKMFIQKWCVLPDFFPNLRMEKSISLYNRASLLLHNSSESATFNDSNKIDRAEFGIITSTI